MLQNVCENCLRILEEEKNPSAVYVRYLVTKVKETGIFIDKLNREKPKTVRTPENIAALAESEWDELKRILHKDLGSGVEANWPSNAFSFR